jgi:hypothetical protein
MKDWTMSISHGFATVIPVNQGEIAIGRRGIFGESIPRDSEKRKQESGKGSFSARSESSMGWIQRRQDWVL